MYFEPGKFETFDLSIALRFDGPQPNAWGVERAVSRPVTAGELIGDTRRGGRVNFEQYTFIPHCSGTHTECVGHITHERIAIRDCLLDVIGPAVLVTVDPEGETDEIYSVAFRSGDRLITKASLGDLQVPSSFDLEPVADRNIRGPGALIVRTLPNDDSKLAAEYGGPSIPPYFTSDAIEYIVECGFRHLLVDLPSIDRIFDDGKLTNHRAFWNVEPDKYEVDSESRIHNTITEMIYVPEFVEDGEYLLNLQIAPFESDCAPSRPILLRPRN